MMWSSFEVRIPGKWVLAGEHAVLRGAAAVTLPLESESLALAFHPLDLASELASDRHDLAIIPGEAEGEILELIQAVKDECQAKGRSFGIPKGTLALESSIPVGAGLGSSAALCVALTRWLAQPLGLQENEYSEFATRLENRFHGQSSGMDVAAVLAAEPVCFVRGQSAQALGIKRLPRFTFHDTGKRTRTKECVAQVEELFRSQPVLAREIDEAMGAASRTAMEGLVRFDSGDRNQGLELISAAMRQGQECFYSWGLVPDEARKLERKVLNQGALATKLTGAGGGGFLVAVWP